jgi:predicted nucleotidyltransferase
MDPRSIDQVWESLDRDHLSAVARRGPPPVFATVSGAHLYGFASPDSDVDLRGAFLLDARTVLGLAAVDETITLTADEPPPGSQTPLELDWVAHDLRKFVRMMVSHNGYAMEQLYSPLVVVTGPLHDELCALGHGAITRPMVRHYFGFARGRRQRLREPDPTVKHLLYAYRVYLSGIHLMRTGELDANLPSLNARFRLGPIDELVERKREGAEKMKLGPDELTTHERRLDELEAALSQAHDQSQLPPGSPAS